MRNTDQTVNQEQTELNGNRKEPVSEAAKGKKSVKNGSENQRTRQSDKAADKNGGTGRQKVRKPVKKKPLDRGSVKNVSGTAADRKEKKTGMETTEEKETAEYKAKAEQNSAPTEEEGGRKASEKFPGTRKKERAENEKKVEEDSAPDEGTEPDLDDDDLSLSDELDESDDMDEGGRMSRKKGLKTFLIVLASLIGVVALVYLGGVYYFTNHFYYNTKINGIDFSMKTVEDVEKYMETQVQGYELTILEKNDVQETISGEEISLVYVESDELDQALDTQNAFLWPTAFFSPESTEVKVNVSYDEAELEQKIQSLRCITEFEQTEPQSAYPKFDGEKFVVEPEVTGMKVDQEVLNQKIKEYISGFQYTLNMEEEGCYSSPKFVSDSPEVIAACETMNNYCKASITYTMGSATEVVDKMLISTWLTYDDDMNVTFNTEAVTQYMKEFGLKYDTVGKTRTITTPTGKTTEVSGGTYGWSVDEATEAQALINSIQNGEVITKEPAYVQTAASHDGADWGTTYIEVDLTTQHMWYIVNGGVAFEADIVTGLPTPDRETPQGVYDILEKLRNKTLRGDRLPDGSYEYETPVSYWMRVTYTGIGFHDATWQPYFGGTRYQYNGSHGCINMSYSDAATLYEMISVGVPVIMHY